MKTKFFILLLFAPALLFSETLKIDMRLNINEADEKNHTNFSYETSTSSTTTKTKIKDKYDAVSGASKSHSTKKTLAVLQNQSKKKILPKTLRSFMLFPVSKFSKIEEDELKISKDETNPEKITVTFNHRGNSYRIESDESGNVYVNMQKKKNGEIKNSFKMKLKQTDEKNGEDGKPKAEESNAADKTSEQNGQKESDKTEITEGSEKDESEKKEDDGFENDGFDEAAEKVYAGKLKLKEKDGILTLKGSLKLVEKPEIKEEKKEADKKESEQTEEQPKNTNEEGSSDEKESAGE